jgi:type II secretory ATPase GspE/PulE/Tfp pilus assembly ATPase PilB-like protein
LGKTTTLYAALNLLHEPSGNLVAIEGPVEIHPPYVRQVQINRDIGLDFAGVLRPVLRQGPGIVLVGEIRDKETAERRLREKSNVN